MKEFIVQTNQKMLVNCLTNYLSLFNIAPPDSKGWAIQGFGQVNMIPIKALLQFSVGYHTDTILEVNFPPDMIRI